MSHAAVGKARGFTEHSDVDSVHLGMFCVRCRIAHFISSANIFAVSPGVHDELRFQVCPRNDSHPRRHQGALFRCVP